MMQSRLDIYIDQVVSKRACLNKAADLVAEMDGPVFELGLGNGRSYNHMCSLLPVNDIFVFEEVAPAHPVVTPPDAQLILGDVFDTMPRTLARFGATARLVHVDLGGHDQVKNDQFARAISPLVEPLLARGAVMVSSHQMYFDAARAIDLPVDAVAGRTFLYQK